MATGAVTITPGIVWGTDNNVTLAKLDQAANPTARVDENTIGRRELITAFVAEHDGVIAGLVTEQTVRADADAALSSSISTVSASFDLSDWNTWENLARYSEYNATYWTDPLAVATVTGGQTDPTGGTGGARYVNSSGSSSIMRLDGQSIALASGDTYTLSFWCKANVLPSGDVFADIGDNVGGASYTSQLLEGEWVRVQVSGQASSTATALWIDLASNPSPTNYDLSFFGVQVKRGPYAGPYAATTADPVTPIPGQISASVTAEATARATADGYLAGSYVVRVDANGNQAGLAITAISDPSGWTTTSEVSITASVFKVADGATKLVPFQIVGSKARFTADVEIDGSLVLTGTLSLTDLADKSLANLDSTANTKLAGIATGADVTLSAVNGGLSVTGGGITLASGSPAIKAGQTAYNSGTGFWLGLDSGTPKFSLGNSSGNRLTWDNSNFNIVADKIIVGTGDDLLGDMQLDGEFSARAFGSGAQNVGFTGTVAQGSVGSPSATASGSFSALRLRGYDGSAYVTAASLRLKSQAGFSWGSNPTEMEVIVSAGASSNYLYFSKDGRLEFGSGRDVNLYRLSANVLCTDDTMRFAGFNGRAGSSGAYQGNAINLYWTGSVVELWVDTTKIGDINVS